MDLGFTSGVHCDAQLTPAMKAGVGVPNAGTRDYSLDNVRCDASANSLSDCASSTRENW